MAMGMTMAWLRDEPEAFLIAGSPSRTKDQIKENGEILKRIYCHYTPVDTFARDCITGRVDLTSD